LCFNNKENITTRILFIIRITEIAENILSDDAILDGIVKLEILSKEKMK